MTHPRTIQLTDGVEIKPAAAGRFVIYEPSTGVPGATDVEVIRPPSGRVALNHYSRHSTLVFGSPVRAILVVNGPRKRLTEMFQALTGVTP